MLGPHRLRYKVHSTEKRTGGLRFLTDMLTGSAGKHFSSLGRRMLYAITPSAERGRNEEEEIDGSFNKPWAQLGITQQPILLRSNFSSSVRQNYILVIMQRLIVDCDLLPQIVK